MQKKIKEEARGRKKQGGTNREEEMKRKKQYDIGKNI